MFYTFGLYSGKTGGLYFDHEWMSIVSRINKEGIIPFKSFVRKRCTETVFVAPVVAICLANLFECHENSCLSQQSQS